MQIQVDLIRDAINKHGQQKDKLFRGVSMDKDKLDKYLNDFKVGETTVMKGITSTSTDKNIAESFAELGHSVVFEINAKKALNISNISHFKEQEEYLLDHLAKYKTKEIIKINDKKTLIKLEQEL
jgi:hypothetical protein